ncbi:hypothetical protein KP509_17G059900 [Ceratopteris richardii]|uniref:Formate acetyltransferase n=1 Tax=Ceratopteris richardii TaxID=49495 RepID=A0A8T2SYQ4_CERRI|nr:hypothetical protein KP509_17G059900 [Ceratopteris richardii]
MTKPAKTNRFPPTLCPHERSHARHLSAEQGNKTSWDIWRVVQRGLVYPSPYAIFMMCWKANDYDVLCNLVTDVRQHIHKNLKSRNTTVVVGVGFALWQEWSKDQGFEIPQGMSFEYPSQNDASQSSVVEESHGVFVDSGGDVLFHIKSDDQEYCRNAHEFIVQRLEVELQCVTTESQEAATKSTLPDKTGGKVLGCRFSENLMNPSDPVTMQENVIIGFEDASHIGGSFIMVQRFMLIWENLLNMSTTEFQDLVGRTFDDVMIPSEHVRSHIKCARVQNNLGDTMAVLRLGLPFGRSPAIDTEDGRQKGASLRDEQGIYFAGLAKSAKVLEEVMHNQVGDNPAFSMRDSLLSNARSNLGGFFYIPNLHELKQEFTTLPRLATNWLRFPGVDWSRLDRHYNLRSANGYMYYNHQDYLYSMGTMVGKDRQIYLPPSNRVLRILANVFSRWQDNWYFDRAQPELEHLHVYVEKYFNKELADSVMQMSIAERMGWAIRMGIGYVFTSHEYGFRGRKKNMTGYISGADTYRMHPAELIVGALPNLGLGQGRYVIDYTREDEKLAGFFSGITYASGVGHVIPDFQYALEKGVSGLIKDVQERLNAATETSKREFYNGIYISLQGVQEHCHAYASLAREMVTTLGSGQLAEKANLEDIAVRMDRLAEERPQTMLEAAQLTFTLHSCLHLTGEPTAIGRLDQLLFPFYTADIANGVLDEDLAQEIIDCFWIKIGEKVQLNRFYVEDHQPYGNLAMGGASGNYPQGAGNNQWVQQVTVGGTVAEAESKGEGQAAYNGITMMCLRAARRLPLNAPCLSLRTRKDMPDEYLNEAALGILSGGAHPFLISDEKIIAGLVRSGDNIGEGSKPTEYTPVAEKAGDCWSSRVDLAIARDYACDGCFEPQLTACNWFTLGGFDTLSPLEAALNQGKKWAMAGPIYFRGQRVSLTTIPPKQIQTFEQLVDLFFDHLKWMYSKDVDTLLSNFGNMAAQCPAPLLSLLTNDCLDKGLDIYGGGARYNVLAPCFTALPNTINSLYSIKQLVFNNDTAMTSLPELVHCLINNWGYTMQEPFVNVLQGPARIEGQAERYKSLREAALALPKYGRGNAEVNALGDMIIKRMSETIVSIFTNPVESTAKKMVELAKRLGTAEKPFGGFQIQPGAGTFENYVEFGSTCGASADGRLNGQPLASNISPIPSPADMAVQPQYALLSKVLDGYTGKGTASVWSGAPTELNIEEEFPVDELKGILKAFAEGAGSNRLNITCANPSTLEGATKNPEKYDILRARMGGWSEFFVAMFPAHQAQHERRPRDIADPDYEEPLQKNKRKRV